MNPTPCPKMLQHLSLCVVHLSFLCKMDSTSKLIVPSAALCWTLCCLSTEWFNKCVLNVIIRAEL